MQDQIPFISSSSSSIFDFNVSLSLTRSSTVIIVLCRFLVFLSQSYRTLPSFSFHLHLSESSKTANILCLLLASVAPSSFLVWSIFVVVGGLVGELLSSSRRPILRCLGCTFLPSVLSHDVCNIWTFCDQLMPLRL